MGKKHVCFFGFEHLSYFTPKTLKNMLLKAGFQIVEIETYGYDFGVRTIYNTLAGLAWTNIGDAPSEFMTKISSSRTIQSRITQRALTMIDYSLRYLPRLLNRDSILKVTARKII